jgi:choline dehydrogenase-like flavoprotein
VGQHVPPGGHALVDGREHPLGQINAGHPGGTLPLTESSAETLHDARLPRNVYVADDSPFTHALGKPPSLTIMVLALRASRAAAARLA